MDEFEEQLDKLEMALGGAELITATFTRELGGMRTELAEAGREIRVLKSGISGGLRRAIDGVVFDGDRLSDSLRQVGQSMLDAAYSAAVRPVTSHVSGVLAQGLENLMTGALGFADGGAFSSGRVRAFAKGGVVSSATTFPMRGGMGLMGEAGPEAILPLARAADGRLGVEGGSGARAINVTVNISTPDVAGFRRSQSQVAAALGRAVSAGQRNR
jgi:hypothetical protein